MISKLFLLATVLQLYFTSGNGQNFQIFTIDLANPLGNRNSLPSSRPVSFDGLPPSPCPNVFQYQYNRAEWTGHISVPPPTSGDPDRLPTIRLEVRLILPGTINNKYVGKLELAESNQAVWQKLRKGSPNNPIYYRVHFPTTSPMPQISLIIVNGNVICSGNSGPTPGRTSTTITLNHTFFPYEISVGGGGGGPPSGGNIFGFQNGGQSVGNQPQEIRPSILDNSNFGVRPEVTPPPTRPPTRPPVQNQGQNQAVQRPQQSTSFDKVTPQTTSLPNFQGRHGNCGKVLSSNSLIAHGENVMRRGDWPWIVALFRNLNDGVGIKYNCGGTLISRYYVLTAAHCVRNGDKNVEPDQLTLYLGKFNLNKWTEPGAQSREVKNIFSHPEYTSSADSDLAVLELSISAEFGPYVQPACTWPTESPDLTRIIGKYGTVVGWGLDENKRVTSSVPKQAKMPVVSQEECLRSDYRFSHFTSNRTFCAGFRNGTGPCNGDSGGGLVFPLPDDSINGGFRWYLRGVVSQSLTTTGKIICDLKNYVIFTDIAKHSVARVHPIHYTSYESPSEDPVESIFTSNWCEKEISEKLINNQSGNHHNFRTGIQ